MKLRLCFGLRLARAPHSSDFPMGAGWDRTSDRDFRRPLAATWPDSPQGMRAPARLSSRSS